MCIVEEAVFDGDSMTYWVDCVLWCSLEIHKTAVGEKDRLLVIIVLWINGRISCRPIHSLAGYESKYNWIHHPVYMYVNAVYLMEDWSTCLEGFITVDAVRCWEVCQVFCSYKGNDTLLFSSKSRKRSPVEVSVHFPSSCISTVEAGNFYVCLRLALYKVEFDE